MFNSKSFLDLSSFINGIWKNSAKIELCGKHLTYHYSKTKLKYSLKTYDTKMKFKTENT